MACLALILCRRDKWESITKLNDTWLITSKWNGEKYSLKLYCSYYQSKHSQIVEAAQYVPFKVPEENTRVNYLLYNIKNQDADIHATISQIRTNSQGTHDDFEKLVAIILPIDPFMKVLENKPKASFEISSTGATKYGRVSDTGIYLKWHKHNKFNKLSTETKDELCTWHNNTEGKEVI